MHMVILGSGRGLQTAIRAVQPLAKRVTVVVPTSNDTGIDALIRRMGPFAGVAGAINTLLANGHNAAQLRVMQQVFAPLGTPYDGVPFAVLDTVAHALTMGSMHDALQRLRTVVDCGLDVLLATEQVHDAWIRSDATERSSVYFGAGHTSPIQGITLEPQVPAHPAVIQALKTADVVVIAPGALYTEVLPALLPDGIAETLRSTKARVVCCAALTSVPGQTDGFRAVDYVARIARAVGRGGVDVALINTEAYSGPELLTLRQQGSTPLKYDAADAEVLDALGVTYLGRVLRPTASAPVALDARALRSHDEIELRMGCMMASKG